jgi:hypothetical protein
MPLGLHLPGRNNDAKKEQAYRNEGYTQQVINSMGPTSAAADQARENLEINIHAIEDEGLLAKLDKLCILPEQRSFAWYNNCGQIVSIGMSAPVGVENVHSKEVVVKQAEIVPWAMALRVLVSKVMPTRFIEKRNVVTYKNRVRADIMKIKRTMSREDRKMFVPFVNEVELYVLTGLDDSVSGQKMLALKTSGRHLKVGVSSQPEGGK